jgi:selenocysteine-specific elongation factor
MAASNVKSIVIGTAGHIDHGKTALVRKLTGIDTDRLPEEKRRGISIDLGFASVDATAPNGERVSLSFVDVPGHKLFIRNMLAGSGGVDCIMLVISAEEEVKPQTEEHLAICSLLGVKRGVTVLSKADAVDQAQVEKAQASVRRFLQGSFLADAPMLPVSAKTGFGLPALLSELSALALEPSLRDTEALPRIPLDRAFTLKGFGTVVTGTLQSGTVTPGQSLVALPGGRQVKVRTVQVHNEQRSHASAGSRVALNVAGVDLPEIRRGDTLVAPSTFEAVSEIDVELTVLRASPALKDNFEISFHAFTSAVPARVSLYECRTLQPGGTGLAKIKLAQPVILLPGDRFVLRQLSPALTIGGGEVLDAVPLPRLSRTKRVEWLKALRAASADAKVLLRITRREAAGISTDSLTRESGWAPAKLTEKVKSLMSSGQVVAISDAYYVSRPALTSALGRVLSEVRSKTGDVLNPGWKRSELRHRTGLNETVFQFALRFLERERKIALQEDRVLLCGSAPKATDADAQKLAALAQAYATAGMNAPLIQSVAGLLKVGEPELRRLMTVLLRDKVLVKIGNEDLYMHRDVLGKLYAQVRNLRGQIVDVGTFKQLTGLSRKYAIPLLEHLDRERITRKQGDSRLVL